MKSEWIKARREASGDWATARENELHAGWTVDGYRRRFGPVVATIFRDELELGKWSVRLALAATDGAITGESFFDETSVNSEGNVVRRTALDQAKAWAEAWIESVRAAS